MISSTSMAGGTLAPTAFGRAHAAGPTGTAAAISGRYAGALQLLSISMVWTRSGSAAVDGGRAGGTGAISNLAAMARTFQEKFGEAAADQPFSPEANQRHIAQYETIMAHRGDFPPGEFFIHTELGDGASITTRVPPIGETKEPQYTKVELAVVSAVATLQTASGAITTASVQAAYAEWS